LLRGRTIGLEYGLNPSENPQLLFQKKPGMEKDTLKINRSESMGQL
jgi:hypothetical protein